MQDTTKAARKREKGQAPGRRRLFEIASEQAGYFTAEQASSCLYSRALLSHHVKHGTFIRVRRGLYRFHEYPSSPHEDILAAWMAVGKNVSVLSHESALYVLGLSDIIPFAIHLTVPRSKRNKPSFPGVKIHTTISPLEKEDTVIRDGMIVTSPERSILDAAKSGTASEQIEMAVAQALDRGLIIPRSLLEGGKRRGSRVSKLIADALSKVKQ